MKHVQEDSTQAVIFDFDGTLAIPTIDFAHMKHSAYKAVESIYPELPELGHDPLLEWMAQAQDASHCKNGIASTPSRLAHLV